MIKFNYRSVNLTLNCRSFKISRTKESWWRIKTSARLFFVFFLTENYKTTSLRMCVNTNDKNRKQLSKWKYIFDSWEGPSTQNEINEQINFVERHFWLMRIHLRFLSAQLRFFSSKSSTNEQMNFWNVIEWI